jgi:hypothetical protein
MVQIRNLFCNASLIKTALIILVFGLQLPTLKLSAQDEKKATINLIFNQSDSTRTCKAVVTCDNVPVKEKEIHFYVKRMYSLLPIGKAIETDENGEASADFPIDLPGDKNGNYIVVVKIEDDDTYGNSEVQSEIKWGIHPKEEDKWNNRSLSASRHKAPMYLIIASNLIITLIWGTILYVVFQVFRIKKEGNVKAQKIINHKNKIV